MPNPNRFNVLRPLLVVLAFLALVGFFFFLNFYLYIPRQQALYHQKTFRVLSEVARDFSTTLEGKTLAIIKNKNSNEHRGNVPRQVQGESIHSLVTKSFRDLDSSADNSKNYQRNYRFTKDSVYLEITDTSKRDSTNISEAKKSDTSKVKMATTTYAIALEGILKPNYEHLHKDLFSLLLLVKRESARNKAGLRDFLLYRIGGIASRYGLIHDSLFEEKNYGQFNTINRLRIQDQNYLAFATPFQFRNQELILTGMVPEKEYIRETARFSITVLLWIAALLLAIILSLPILKIRMSARSERVSINEVRVLIMVFVVTPFLVVLAVGAMLVYQLADLGSNHTLALIEHQVETKLGSELDAAIRQLQEYDQITGNTQLIDQAKWREKDENCKAKHEPALPIGKIHKDLGDTQIITNDGKDIIYYPQLYANLDDIFWVNDVGQQIGKWFFRKEKVSYLDVSSRDYYTKIVEGAAPRLANNPNQHFYIEPTISWATGDYSVNVVTTSNQQLSSKETADARTNAVLIGMASRLYSIYNPVVAKGYQFAIINRKGDILFHSETERCLHENILEEANHHPALLNAMARNDQLLLPDMRLYNRDVKMRIKPWDRLPEFYLLTYYNKREQNLFVFHIAAFTLLAMTTLLVTLLIFHLFKSLLTKKRDQINFRLDYPSQWMRPSKERSGMYSAVLLQFSVTAGLMALLIPVVNVINEQRLDEYIFQAFFLLPLLITTSYFLTSANQKEEQRAAALVPQNKEDGPTTVPLSPLKWMKTHRGLLLYYALFVGLVIALLARLLHDCRYFHLDTLLVAGLALTVPVQGYLQHRYSQWFALAPNYDEFKKYLSLLAYCIVLVAALPTVGFMYYAYRQENVLRIKSEQLQAAKDIDNRRIAINKEVNKTKLNLVPSAATTEYIRNRKLHPDYGIYLPHQTLQAPSKLEPQQEPCTHLPDNPPLYIAATRLLLLPNDHEDYFQNSSRNFWMEDQQVCLVHKNLTDFQTADGLQLTASQDATPAFTDLWTNLGMYIILLLAIIFFLVHMLLVRSTTRRVFLLDYFDTDKTNLSDTSWCNQFYQHLPTDEGSWNGLGQGNIPDSNTAVKEIEDQIAHSQKGKGILYMRLQQLLTPAFDAMWNHLSPEEQLVLYDFSLDGFTNYRNTDIIYSLLQKGLIIRPTDGHLEVMTDSFRNYLMGKNNSPEVKSLEKMFNVRTNWKSLKNIAFAALLAALIFLFATQQDLSDKLLAIISGLVTLVPFLVKLFDRPVTSDGLTKDK